MRVVVAMSGGVDSSVAAALLREEGHEVIGLTMQLLPRYESNCCGRDTIKSARRAAFRLGIPHYVVDFRERFASSVIDDFCREYSLGRTPNPCVICNNDIKFGALWEKAAEMGADYIATGHYARTEWDNDRVCLKKGIDTKKDQSYFLCRLTCEQLRHTIFPVGRFEKNEVRRIAREMGLPTAGRPESQEVCFIPDGDHAGFLHRCLKPSPGPILDGQGKVLGEHRGITSYTIGQRHRLGLAAAEPVYVTAIAPDRNAIIIGTRAQTYGTELIAGHLNWIVPGPPSHPFSVKARVRYRHQEAEAMVTPLDDYNYYVKFATPQMAITPGQTVAFYNGDTVIGGGMIVRQGR